MSALITHAHKGMAVICASLVNSHGQTMVPQPGVVSPATGSCPLDLQCEEAMEEAMQCQIQELSEPHPLTGQLLQFHSDHMAGEI